MECRSILLPSCCRQLNAVRLFDSALESKRSRRSPTSLCRKLNCGGVFLNLQARMDDRPHLLTTR